MKTFSVIRSVANLDAAVLKSHYNNSLIHFKKCLYLKKGFSQLSSYVEKRKNKAIARVFSSWMVVCEWGQLWVSVADSLTSGLVTKGMLDLNTSPLCMHY